MSARIYARAVCPPRRRRESALGQSARDMELTHAETDRIEEQLDELLDHAQDLGLLSEAERDRLTDAIAEAPALEHLEPLRLSLSSRPGRRRVHVLEAS